MDRSIADAFDVYLRTASLKKTVSSQKIDRRVLAIARWYLENEMKITALAEIRLDHLEQFEIWAGEAQTFAGMTKDAWGQASILRHTKTLKSILKKAFQTGELNRDPTAMWKIASPELNGKRRPMSDDEFERLLDLAPEWFKPILRILAATGARGSSIARLKWSDVDFTKGEVYFSSRKGGTKREKRQTFPMFPALREILEGQSRVAEVTDIDLENKVISVTPRHPPGDYVFLKNGQPVSGPLISMTGYKLIRRAGLTGVVLYGLRHKFATDLLRAGTSTEIARRLMGHSNENMLKQYTQHLGTEALADAVSGIRGKK